MNWIYSRGQDEGYGPVIKSATEAYDGFSFDITLVYDSAPIEYDYPCGIVVKGYACGAEMAVDTIWGIDVDGDDDYLTDVAKDLVSECAIECRQVVERIVANHG